MTRDEHIAWCKKRALPYVEAGKLERAVGSMTSDMMKHPYTADAIQIFAVDGMMAALTGNGDAVRRWIEGFN